MMRFLTSLLTIRPPSDQRLLDIAIVITLLPHLFVIKLPMMLFLLLALFFITRRSFSKNVEWLLVISGLVALGLSFISNYNFASFSRLLVFISLLVSLLIYAIALQRYRRKINFYLTIAPAMLMVLSFFFFNSITMLFYSLSALFILVLLTLWHRMQSSLIHAIRYTIMLFVLSLPMVALLFMVFPRISFQKATFGFKAEVVTRTGHDGTMHLDAKALEVLSEKVVMEVAFPQTVPRDETLYFRGSALYIDKTTMWDTLPKYRRETGIATQVKEHSNRITYDVTLYPHKNRWLYALDIPTAPVKHSYIDSDLMLTSTQPVNEILRYRVTSALNYRLMSDKDAILPEAAYETDETRDPEIKRRIDALITEDDTDAQRLQKVQLLFRSLQLKYTLKPAPMDMQSPVDAFLFTTKTGYCVHFAAAFAKSARLAGLPSRIITGYKASRENAVNNYLVVKEKDAHAWVEVYLEEKGWIRIEPTAYVIASEAADAQTTDAAEALQGADASQRTLFKVLFERVNLYYMYAKYKIDYWFLNYDRLKQTMLWKKLVEDTLFLAKFAAYVMAFLALCVGIFAMARRRRCNDRLACSMERLFKILRKRGIERSDEETIKQFLLRSADTFPKIADQLSTIADSYHRMRYGRREAKGFSVIEQAIKTVEARLK
jgi:transglutaminase-like putative cysteine protease